MQPLTQSLRRLFAALSLAGVLLSVSSCIQAQQVSDADRAAWANRLHNLIPNSIEGIRTVQDLNLLPADTAFQVLAENWKSLTNTEAKSYILSCIVQNDNPHVLDILDLGVMDPSIAIQNKSLQFCESFGFDTFTEDYDTYLKWRQETRGLPLSEVMAMSLKSLATALPAGDELRRSALMNILVRSNFNAASQTSRMRREAAIVARIPEALVPWIKQQNNLMWTAFQVIRNIKPGEQFLKKQILPLTDPQVEASVRYQALNSLGSPDNAWATEPLMKMMLAEYPDPAAEMIGQSLSQIGDPRIIPMFVSIMEADNTQEGNRVVGNILSPLTGVSNAYIRDAKWWRSWWQRNNKRFPADVRNTPFPRVVVRARPLMQIPQNGFARPAQPVLRQIAGDAKRAYWFIDPRENVRRGAQAGRPATQLAVSDVQPNSARLALSVPGEGLRAPHGAAVHFNEEPAIPGLIVVLTSDGDAASASSFWQDVAVKALARQYYIAVVSAPKWADTQSIIWVTSQDLKAVKEAKSSVESLLTDVVKDVQSTNNVDHSKIYLHGVGAGGAAAYATSLDAKNPFKGFYILSATFKSAALPPLENAAGRRYLIQNARDDKAHPYWMAEAAQKLLSQKGATIKLDPGQGYLGSQQPEVFMPQIKACFDWFSTQK